ncbi:MAG: EAL domain-containing protein [Sideroxyarcus sp.]|nr:EAL domain-containing protein [Sideroxyarcus sp.]
MKRTGAHGKGMDGRPHKKNGSARSLTVDASIDITQRETAVRFGERAADLRQGSADRRQVAADKREGTADLRQVAADKREGTADLRQVDADRREGTADLRQVDADKREGTADLRQVAADKREGTADLRQVAADEREGTADLRQVDADKREGTADLRQDVADKREGTADLRHEAADKREGTADLRQEAADVRENTADRREGTADLRHQAADKREGTADLRQEAADVRENTADKREGTADLRQEAADRREDTADLRQGAANLRQGTADLRQAAADKRQEAADLREEAATLRMRAMLAQEIAARADAELEERVAAQLREVNERLIHATLQAQAMTEAAELATAQMSHMAEHDFLTGLPNRALLTDRLMQAIVLAQRNNKKVALMYLDLDHFKHINDSLGHAAGDQLLQSVTKRLQASVRLSDTVSRQGGDEFVVLLHEIETEQDAILAAEKLIAGMAEPHLIASHRLHITLSIGIGVYPDDGKDAETVLRNADTAMYHAKRSGRNNYQLFTPDMNARAVERQSVEEELHHALEHGKFVLHYQTKVNLVTGTITGAEALLRLRHNGQPPMQPTQFVGVAEECGLIVPIGNWVLREACRQTRVWQQAGLDIGQIAVNVSAKEFHHKDFLSGVRNVLQETGLDPHCLELEMTESVLMQDTEQTAAILRALKEIGVQIAVDDFGTGYSSLSYLRSFQVDTLKIDQSFVMNIDGDGNAEADADNAIIVNAIIGMGRNLNQRVVAEGVETQQQLDFLLAHACAEGQGFYFDRPVPADEFAGLLATGKH